MMTDWPVSWYGGEGSEGTEGCCGGGGRGRMGTLEKDIHAQIEELQSRQDKMKCNKRDFYNWELSFNRLELMIDKLHKQQKVAKILES